MKTLTPIIEGLHYANTLCSIIASLHPPVPPPPHRRHPSGATADAY